MKKASNNQEDHVANKQAEIEEILHRVDSYPVLDSRSPEEIIGYDGNGLPAECTRP